MSLTEVLSLLELRHTIILLCGMAHLGIILERVLTEEQMLCTTILALIDSMLEVVLQLLVGLRLTILHIGMDHPGVRLELLGLVAMLKVSYNFV